MGIIKKSKENRYTRKIKKQTSSKDSRRHFTGLFFVAVCVLFVVAIINIVLIKGYRHLSQSSLFSISCIDVEGNKYVQKDEIIKLSGLKIGQNLLALNIKQISWKVISHPWISECRIIQHLPSAITINIAERKPVAFVNLDKLWYFDETGEIFGPLSNEDTFKAEKLSVITGLDKFRIKQKSTIKTINLLIDKIDVAEEWPSEFNFSTHDKVTVFFAPSGSPVVMNLPVLEENLHNLNYVAAGLKKMKTWEGINKIRFDIGDYAVVSFDSNIKNF